LRENGHNADGIVRPREGARPFATRERRSRRRTGDLPQFPRAGAPLHTVSPRYNLTEILMKTLTTLAALSLSFVLGLMPFAVIAMNDLVATKV
jgi:hypothetical protein